MMGTFYKVNDNNEVQLVQYEWPDEAIAAYLNEIYSVDTFEASAQSKVGQTITELPPAIQLV